MADCTALPSLVHSWVRRKEGRAVFSVPGRFSFVRLPRRALHGKKINVTLSLRNPSWTALEGDWHDEGRAPKCHCFGSLANSEGLAPQWLPVIDQVLLTASIVLAYMGGVVPHGKSLFSSRKDQRERQIAVEETTSSGRVTEKTLPLDAGEFWSTIGDKLTDALKANENDDYFASKKSSTNCSLSLLTVAESPRLRLLCITAQRLQNEVMNALPSYEGISRDGWLVVSYQILGQVISPACLLWLEREFSLKNRDNKVGFLTERLNKLGDDDSILESLTKMGKSELYADLLYFLRFGSLCNGHIIGNDFLTEHGVDVLEDLVINLADVISSQYLELISIDSGIADEIDSWGLNLCLLSTRELQRIRNEVALRQWIIRNFESVSSMYEDRFDLCTLRAQYHERPINRVAREVKWWQRLARANPESTLLPSLQIARAPVQVKRTKELRALTGWRYYYSLFLELSDVAMPLVKVVAGKGRDAISFLLTCLIGRSLGLIYTGIRQALGFR